MPPSATGSPHGSARIQPKRPLPPRRRPAVSSDAATVKPGQERRKATRNVPNACMSFQPGRLLRIDEHVVEADRQAEDEQHHENDPPHLVGEEVSARGLRHDRVERRRRRESARSRRSGGASTRRAPARGRRRSSAPGPSEAGRSWKTTSTTTPTIVQAQRIAQLVIPNCGQRKSAAGVLPLPGDVIAIVIAIHGIEPTRRRAAPA